ncbi:MAG: ribonuclease J [Spirochaetes bacterium]|nr:ribonuclease J [Spirochaetota bacterium]
MRQHTVKENGDNLKVCVLSGADEIGRNCSFVEYRDTIIIIDCGFSFPSEQMFGYDYMIPNAGYLRKNRHKIKAVLITHGHLDHTGGLEYLLPDLGFPPVYAGRFAVALMRDRFIEKKLNRKVRLIDVDRNTGLSFGPFRASFIGVTHSIPNSFSIFIESPGGNVFFSGDYKIDEEPANELETDYARFRSLRGRVDLALMESTNAAVPGKSKSATEIAGNLEDIIRSCRKRVIVASFSSLVSRIHSVLTIARKTNRKVVLAGRSLVNAVRIAREQRYINIPDSMIVPETKVNHFPDDRVLIFVTGSQGEENAALNRISKGEHRYVKIKRGDLVLLSASEIPDNVAQIGEMTDRLIAAGADIIKSNMMDIHATGHGLIDDMKMMYDMIAPKYAMPIHGGLTLRYQNSRNFIRWGMKPEQVFLTADGQVWEYNGRNWRKTYQVEAQPILIDGMGASNLGSVVLRDRQQMAEFGMLTVLLHIGKSDGALIGTPRFVSRGFVNAQAAQHLIKDMNSIVSRTHREWLYRCRRQGRFEQEKLIADVEYDLADHIGQTIERKPLIIVVIQ